MTGPPDYLIQLWGDHDWAQEERVDPDSGKAEKWNFCRRCGAAISESPVTQSFPSRSCDKELARAVMKS